MGPFPAGPSESHRLLTQDIIAASHPFALKALDHLIVGNETTFSFADGELLDELEVPFLAPGDAADLQDFRD